MYTEMDVSNPVTDHHKSYVSEVLKGQQKRQDFAALRSIIESSQRILLAPGRENVLTRAEANETALTLSTSKRVAIEKAFEQDSDGLEVCAKFVAKGHVPICNLKREDGTAIHPASVCRVKSDVSVQRNYQSAMLAKRELSLALQTLPEEVVREVYNRTVYTSGTRKGFSTRIEKQMLRKTRPSMQVLSSGKYVEAQVNRALDLLFAVDHDKLQDVFFSPLEDVMQGLKITPTSSAGFPYCRNNRDSMVDMFESVLPQFVEALKGTAEEFKTYREKYPELFLVEIKNKVDRYKVEELLEKTRPYVCLPMHIKLLCSVLCQYFQLSFSTFDLSPKSSNAYGFSGAHGGLTRFYHWMLDTKRNKMKYTCYGDDTCIVYRDRDGVLWRIDPDFQQMDGSVDRQTILAVTTWIYRSFANKFGESVVWAKIASLWAEMSCAPRFIIEGQETYEKPAGQGGMMSGTVGTTLFDTVKAMCVWEHVKEACIMKGRTPLEVEFVNKEVEELGMVIKPGTYVPSRVPEGDLPAGTLLTDHKFLGQRMQVQYLKDQLVVVPSLHFEEWLELLLTPRSMPFIGRGEQPKPSYTEEARTRFDQFRGYLVTGAVFDDQTRDFIYHQVDLIPAEAILMRVQADGGRGAKLLPSPLLETDLVPFSYPNSSGVPTYDWTLNLYAAPEVKDPESDVNFLEIISSSDMQEVLRAREPVSRVSALLMDTPATPAPVRSLIEVPKDEWVVPVLPEVAVIGESGNKAKPQRVKMTSQPPIVKPEVGAPLTTARTLDTLFSPPSGDLASLNSVVAATGLAAPIVVQEAIKRGYFVAGDLIVKDPVMAPIVPPEYASLVDAVEEARVDVVTEYTSGIVQLKESVRKGPYAMIPTNVQPISVPPAEGHFAEGSCQDRFAKYVNQNSWRALFKTEANRAITVGEGGEKRSLSEVTVVLWLQYGRGDHNGWKPLGPDQLVARATAYSAKEAREAVMRYLVNRWTERVVVQKPVYKEERREKVVKAAEQLPEDPLIQAINEPHVADAPQLAPVSGSALKLVIPKAVEDWFEQVKMQGELARIKEELLYRSAQMSVSRVGKTYAEAVANPLIENPEPVVAPVVTAKRAKEEFGDLVSSKAGHRRAAKERRMTGNEKTLSPEERVSMRQAIRHEIYAKEGRPKTVEERKRVSMKVTQILEERLQGAKPVHEATKKVKHIKGDLIASMREHDIIVHCISADAAMSAGFAKQLEEKLCFRDELPVDLEVGRAYIVPLGDYTVVNLVTKRRKFDKPMLSALQESMHSMVQQMHKPYETADEGLETFRMPAIASGLDRLPWSEVENALEAALEGSRFEALVYHLAPQSRSPSTPRSVGSGSEGRVQSRVRTGAPERGARSPVGKSTPTASETSVNTYREGRRRQNKNRRERLREAKKSSHFIN